MRYFLSEEVKEVKGFDNRPCSLIFSVILASIMIPLAVVIIPITFIRFKSLKEEIVDRPIL